MSQTHIVDYFGEWGLRVEKMMKGVSGGRGLGKGVMWSGKKNGKKFVLKSAKKLQKSGKKKCRNMGKK